MFSNLKARLVISTVLLCGFSSIANASLIGDTVRIQISAVDTTFEVFSGPDPDFDFSSFHWNVESESIEFFIDGLPGFTLAPGVFFILSDLDWVGDPTGILVGASIDSSGGLFAGGQDSILSVIDHAITVDLSSFAGGSLGAGGQLLISLQTDHSDIAVSEPGVLLLMLVGLIGIGFMNSRHRPPVGPVTWLPDQYHGPFRT